jgi:Arc/MetJ-type ribon-helix-helix transcriptional regulator
MAEESPEKRMEKEIEELIEKGEYGKIPEVIRKYLPEIISKAGVPSKAIPSESSDWEDIAELRVVLKSVTEFLDSIVDPLRRLLDVLFSTFDGSKLGKEVGTFYKNLIESGVPEDIAAQLTREYFEKRLSIADIAKLFKEALGKGFGKGIPGFQRITSGNIEIKKEEEEANDNSETN